MFYVYTRYGNWLEVGASTTKPDGWIKATDTTAWNQALTLLFTDRSQRQPVLFFKDHKAIMDVCQAEDLPGSLSKLRAEAKAAQQGDAPADLPILAVEPDDAQGAVSRNRFYLMPKWTRRSRGPSSLKSPPSIPAAPGTSQTPTPQKTPRTTASRARASQWSSTRPFP